MLRALGSLMMQMVRRALLPLLWVSSFAPLGLYGEEVPGYYQASNLPEQIVQSFIEAVRTDGVWKTPETPLTTGATPSGEQKLLWSGSEISTSLTIGNPTVKFSRGPEQFEVEITREEGRFIFRSSAPSHPAFAAGVIAPYSISTSFRKFIPGANDTGFVAIIPKMSPSDWYAIGLCPSGRTKSETAYQLSPSGFIATAIQFDPKAEVSARQDTGEAIGKAYVSIRTTPNIPRAVTFERSAEQASPRLTTMYFPARADKSPSRVESLSAGIQLFAELISPAKNSRSKKVEGLAQVIPFDLPTPIEFTQDGRKSSFDGKACVAIVRGMTSLEVF